MKIVVHDVVGPKGRIQETASKEGCPVLQQLVDASNADPKIPLPTGVSHEDKESRTRTSSSTAR